MPAAAPHIEIRDPHDRPLGGVCFESPADAEAFARRLRTALPGLPVMSLAWVRETVVRDVVQIRSGL